MANYIFHPTLLLRSPVYSYTNYSEKNLAEVLKQPFFQQAIYFSSEVFYDELKKVNFELDKLEKKAIDTLKKYFNRMCFRPTPFGVCTVFGPVHWSENETRIQFENTKLQPHIQFSYAKNIEYANAILNTHCPILVYKANPTFYKTGTEYRFLKPNRDNEHIEFVIDSLKSDRFFEKILRYLGDYHTQNEISGFICQQANCDANEADDYIQWLIDSRIISHNLEANITGQDYLARLIKSNAAKKDSEYLDTKQILERATAIQSIDDLQNISAIANDIKSNDLYVNLGINLDDPTLAEKYKQDIIDGLNCLDYLTSPQQPAGLSDFVKRFSQKFEGQAVPLLIALDPEIGVGYGNLAVEEDDVNIVKNIQSSNRVESKAIAWTDVHAMFFNKWKSANNADNIITLTDEDLKGLKKFDEPHAPTISVIFRVVDDRVFIETAGGACAAALIGRFTPFNKDIEKLARSVASMESLNNPDVIFAEIAHICHDKTANIERRSQIYDHEIPVLVQPGGKESQQIPLDDLWVSVINGQIILQSKTHNKRVIPRLSTAFNYARNDLAIFRFLCDLQKGYIKTNFGFDLSQFFPGLSFYPRVQYNNIILRLAYWNFKKDVFDDILKADVANKITLFKHYREQHNLPKYIALTQDDHQLVFNLDREPDVLFFLDNIKGKQTFTIKEYLLPSGDDPIVAGSNGPHVNQFVASLYHTNQVYKPITKAITSTKQTRTFIPGSEWLYLKLYCHSIRANEILCDCIGGILKKLNKDKLVNDWFFIRYYDPEYHIRLRLRVGLENQQRVLNILHGTINSYVNNGIISNYKIETYERELERYSPQFINEFEHAFYASSNFVLAFLQQNDALISAKDILEFAIVSVNDITENLGMEGKQLIDFLDRVFGAFAIEFSLVNDLKYQLDIEYRKQKAVIESVRLNSNQYCNTLKLNKARALFVNSLKHLKQTISIKGTWQDKWVSDLIHMHLNRLFITEPRKQEMAIYYFLSKHERSAQARLKGPK